MEMQDVEIKFPEIKLVIGDTVMSVLKPYTVRVDAAKDIKSAIKSKIPKDTIFWTMKQKIIRALKKGVNIKLADGTVVSLAMNHQHGWQFDIPISTSMLNKATGQHVPVTYAAFVHNGLYKLKHNDAFRVSTKAKATLIELGYVNGDYTITVLGQDVLDRLAGTDPSTDSSCRMKLTRAMFCRQDPTLPAFEWAKNNNFIEYVKANTMPRQSWYVLHEALPSRGACWYPTKIGAAWLEKNAVRINKHHSCSTTRKIEMIPFMPLSHLSEYLSHTDKDIRGLAERRLRILQARHEEEVS